MSPSLRSALLTAGAYYLLACARGTHRTGLSESQVRERYGSVVEDGFERLRNATRRFASLDSAVASGYAREVQLCYIHPLHRAMGYHHLNRTYVDRTVDVDHPEILLYERKGDGRYELNGVEFIVPYRVWPRDSVPPKLLGLDMKPEDELKIWYLHMWAWTDNAAGLFADYNPAVKCLPGSQTAQLKETGGL